MCAFYKSKFTNKAAFKNLFCAPHGCNADTICTKTGLKKHGNPDSGGRGQVLPSVTY